MSDQNLVLCLRVLHSYVWSNMMASFRSLSGASKYTFRLQFYTARAEMQDGWKLQYFLHDFDVNVKIMVTRETLMCNSSLTRTRQLLLHPKASLRRRLNFFLMSHLMINGCCSNIIKVCTQIRKIFCEEGQSISCEKKIAPCKQSRLVARAPPIIDSNSFFGWRMWIG